MLVAEGKPYGVIAEHLHVSYKTVANTCTQLKAKLGVRHLTRADAHRHPAPSLSLGEGASRVVVSGLPIDPGEGPSKALRDTRKTTTGFPATSVLSIKTPN